MEILLRLTREELATAHNALNEICNIDHIQDWEFQTRLGVTRDEARLLLAKTGALLDKAC